jgi:hypothetical protein
MRMTRIMQGLTAGLVGSALLLAAIPAGASPARPALTPHGLPPGYTVVSSAAITAVAGVQTPASVSCPGSEQPSEGGANAYSGTWAVNINSSYPVGNAWEVWVNNASAYNYTFYVYAICLKANANEQIVTSEGYVNPDQTNSATAECPKGLAVVGGGASVSSEDIWLGMNSSTANQFRSGRTAWTSAITDADNVNGEDFWTFAICRPKPHGYAIVTGATALPAPGSGIQMAAICPGNSKAVGGGGYVAYQYTDAGEYMVDLYTNLVRDGAWYTSYENGSNYTRAVTVTAVCAGS